MADGVASIGFGELGWRVQEFRESKIIIISLLLLPIITRTMFEIHFFPRTYFRVDFVYDIRMFICFVLLFRFVCLSVRLQTTLNATTVASVMNTPPRGTC